MNMFTVCSKLGEQSTVDVCTYKPKAQEHLPNYARGTRAYESTIDYSPCSYMNTYILAVIHTYMRLFYRYSQISIIFCLSIYIFLYLTPTKRDFCTYALFIYMYSKHTVVQNV